VRAGLIEGLTRVGRRCAYANSRRRKRIPACMKTRQWLRRAPKPIGRWPFASVVATTVVPAFARAARLELQRHPAHLAMVVLVFQLFVKDWPCRGRFRGGTHAGDDLHGGAERELNRSAILPSEGCGTPPAAVSLVAASLRRRRRYSADRRSTEHKVRALSNEAILEHLAGFGIVTSADEFLELASAEHSANAVAEDWRRSFDVGAWV
jgi:hypothetical protein